MTKLDEIQERIERLRTHALAAVNEDEARIMRDIVSELKRIVAERKAMDKLLIELAAKDT